MRFDTPKIVLLVDQRQIFVTLPILNFVNADRGDVCQVLMNDSPFNHPADRSKYAVPARAEDCGDFLPAEPFFSCRQKHTIRVRLLIFAAGPRDSFHDGPALRTVAAAHCINQKDRDCPQRDKLKSPRDLMIVARTFLAAA